MIAGLTQFARRAPGIALGLLAVVGALGVVGGLRIAGDYLAAFFDQTLRGQDSVLLGGSSAVYPEVEFQSR